MLASSPLFFSGVIAVLPFACALYGFAALA
jgi:hypothetical protein